MNEILLKIDEVPQQHVGRGRAIVDPKIIEDIVGKDKKPEMTTNGYYTRLLSKVPKRITKKLYGKVK